VTKSPARSPSIETVTRPPTKKGKTRAPTAMGLQTTCEEQIMYANCPSGQTVRISNAVWGRTDTQSDICGPDAESKCSVDVTEELFNACKKNSACLSLNKKGNNLVAVEEFLDGLGVTDPCPNAFKYLEYTYTCK